jgi:hypothetical protein
MPLTPEQAAVIAASANGREDMEDLDESTLASLQRRMKMRCATLSRC